jgi:hypothetical protein
MEYPDNVLRIAERAAKQHPDDITKAVDCAERDVRALPEFREIVAVLVRGAVQGLVYEARHQTNRSIRREAGEYGGPAKVSGASDAVNTVYKSVYDYCIGRTTLGRVLGKELPGIAESERAIAEGHVFNAELCEALSRMVPEERAVKDAVPEKKLRGLFRRLQRKVGGDRAV